MGYDKTDELTINTIRVLAVSLSFLPRRRALFSPCFCYPAMAVM